MQPDEPTDEERQEQLPEDNQTPFQPAAPAPDPTGGVVNDPVAQAASDSMLDSAHPATDTNMQPEEQYDEGVSGAAEAAEPNAGNAAANYTPPSTDAPASDGDAGEDDSAQSDAGSDSDNIVVG